MLSGHVPGNGQGDQAVEEWLRAPGQCHGVGGEAQAGQAAQQRVDGNLAFETGKRCTEAIMDAVAETEVALRIARHVERVGMRELVTVTVGAAHHGDDEIALL